MTYEQVLRVIDQFSEEELQRLRQYLDQKQATQTLTPEERIRRLDAAFDAMREGLTSKELAEMAAAMNEEYIEPWDESEWTD